MPGRINLAQRKGGIVFPGRISTESSESIGAHWEKQDRQENLPGLQLSIGLFYRFLLTINRAI